MKTQSGTHGRTAAWDRLNRLRKQRRVQNFATLGLVVLGPVLAVLTYMGLGPFELDPTSSGIRLILLADLVYVLVVAALVAQKVGKIVASRRANSAGSQLHLRLTGVFALVALIPTVLVAIFAVVTLNFGLEGWFSDRVRNVVGTSLSAAQAYEKKQHDDLSEDALRLAGYMNIAKQTTNFISDSDLRQVLTQAQEQVQRGLKEAFIVDGVGNLKARGNRSYRFDFEPVPEVAFKEAQNNKPVVIEDWPNNEFRSLLRLSAYPDRYLYISRTVDGEILSLLDQTQETVRLYQQLENDRGRLLFEFGLIYLGFALILILAAIWLGLWFAERLARPVGQLASAAQRVGAGDLDVQVIEAKSEDEIALLGRLFNQMTRELKVQRETLLSNTEQIERRRRLFDSVLSSVTAGVIGLDADNQITFMNRSALRLLDLEGETDISGALTDAVPEFGSLLTLLADTGAETAQEEVKITRRGQLESLLVRIATRNSEYGDLEGYVLAFDDVSELVSAQKMAAWGDVARRIAHEIKNPLTPIQLSAERLKRKFAPLAGDELESLEQYTDVIIRQTNDLRRIVDEFSKFARMPEPELRETDLMKLVRDAVVLQQSGQPGVEITLECGEPSILADLDQTMIGQALTNLIKNAGEAIESYQEAGAPDSHTPQIKLAVSTTDKDVTLTISDNGIGLPEDRTRLFEPYVTTRAKGTGLGLPIVKKIIEEHGGSLVLRDADPFDDTGHQGAKAVVKLPRLSAAKRKNVA
ncbi:two-component system nitrogen regulation sensor histidine kinase NtrY [Litoreibacter meonggei]|uniref:histidine kinase n=1 Tax=Litoreibacter meonggei TaxID=1049199 RepID=A0A497VSC3_9RHOB|nr:PAS domain-containing sensor histidine kinase [Litoreibacter meonggei]RLJ41816.1 two-component system nitrogen regulation sensor histidine kinase NtrY [Litoreibacter meonggei]